MGGEGDSKGEIMLTKEIVLDRLETIVSAVQFEVTNEWTTETMVAAIALIKSTESSAAEKLRADNLRLEAEISSLRNKSDEAVMWVSRSPSGDRIRAHLQNPLKIANEFQSWDWESMPVDKAASAFRDIEKGSVIPLYAGEPEAR